LSGPYFIEGCGECMSETPILRDTVRSTGRSALQKNIQAALALSGAIRSTLGPKGLDKLLIDDDGRTLVTNDGVTVLETAKVEHPVAKMMINASSTQDKIAKDGTTTTVILAAEMLQNAWQLILQGIHPSTIARGFRKAEQFVLTKIDGISFEVEERLCKNVVKTSLAGKGYQSMQNTIAEISLEAVKMVFEGDGVKIDPTKIKLISQTGGKVDDSRVMRGFVLAKKRISTNMPKEIKNGKIMLLDGGLENRSMKTDLKLNVTDVGVLESFRKKEREMLFAQINHMENLGVNVLACREGIDDDVKKHLEGCGIQAFRRVSNSDLDLLSKACNATMVGSIISTGSDSLGSFNVSKNINLDGKDFWVVESEGKAATIIAKGSTTDIVGEVERCFDDSLGVSIQLIENKMVLCGGGASYVALARRLRRFAETMPGREQLAVEAYADAIEVVVRVLAENAGIDPISSLLSVVAGQINAKSDRIGINLETGDAEDMGDLGVLEPVGIVKQAIIGATEVSISVLRIDDVLWAKQDIQIPDLAQDGM
tara:strand:+ start:2533 stop:4152 length:1620 start_codon:yes stop_codon:yes gene_type:complete